MTRKRTTGALASAAQTGDYHAQLKAVRDLISRQLDSGEVMPRDMAALTKRYLDVCKEIAAIEAEEKKSDPAASALATPMENIT